MSEGQCRCVLLEKYIDCSPGLGNYVATNAVLPFSQEIAACKLQILQDRRQINLLREKHRHFEATLMSQEAMISAADYARVGAETRLLVRMSKDANESPHEMSSPNKSVPPGAFLRAQSNNNTRKPRCRK